MKKNKKYIYMKRKMGRLKIVKDCWFSWKKRIKYFFFFFFKFGVHIYILAAYLSRNSPVWCYGCFSHAEALKTTVTTWTYMHLRNQSCLPEQRRYQLSLNRQELDENSKQCSGHLQNESSRCRGEGGKKLKQKGKGSSSSSNGSLITWQKP